MAGRPAFDPRVYLGDIRRLQGRGWPADRIAAELGMSRATYFRLLAQLKAGR